MSRTAPSPPGGGGVNLQMVSQEVNAVQCGMKPPPPNHIDLFQNAEHLCWGREGRGNRAERQLIRSAAARLGGQSELCGAANIVRVWIGKINCQLLLEAHRHLSHLHGPHLRFSPVLFLVLSRHFLGRHRQAALVQAPLVQHPQEASGPRSFQTFFLGGGGWRAVRVSLLVPLFSYNGISQHGFMNPSPPFSTSVLLHIDAPQDFRAQG